MDSFSQRYRVERVHSIRLWAPCHEDLVIVVPNDLRRGRRLSEWLVLLFKLTSGHLKLNIVHRISLRLNVTLSNGNHLGLVSSFHSQQREDISLKVIIQFKEQALQGQSGKMFLLMNVP